MLVSRRKHEVLQNFLVNGCRQWLCFSKNTMNQHQQMTLHPNHHRLWKLNTGLQATWAMIFSTLPPDSRTVVSKWNTKLALIWKEDFGPLGNSPVLLLFSPGKTPLTTTVANFLDTSVCGGSWPQPQWIFLIHEFHNLSWITEINELFHDILMYWDAPVHMRIIRWDGDIYDCSGCMMSHHHSLDVMN